MTIQEICEIIGKVLDISEPQAEILSIIIAGLNERDCEKLKALIDLIRMSK